MARYFRPDTSKKAIGWWAAAGLFLSCVVLEIAGAGSATAASAGASLGDPTGTFTGHLPTALADLTLLAIALGAVCANVLNIYSGAMSFVAIGIKLPLALRRAIVALVAGVIGFIVAWTGLNDAAAKYTDFLLIISYWIAPWLAVMFCDQFLYRRRSLAEVTLTTTAVSDRASISFKPLSATSRLTPRRVRWRCGRSIRFTMSPW